MFSLAPHESITTLVIVDSSVTHRHTHTHKTLSHRFVFSLFSLTGTRDVTEIRPDRSQRVKPKKLMFSEQNLYCARDLGTVTFICVVIWPSQQSQDNQQIGPVPTKVKRTSLLAACQ